MIIINIGVKARIDLLSKALPIIIPMKMDVFNVGEYRFFIYIYMAMVIQAVASISKDAVQTIARNIGILRRR